MRWWGLLVMSVLGLVANAQCDQRPSEAELTAIAERGRALAEYDRAAWHATDAVQTANPKTVEGQHCIGKKENGRWTVMFGILNADKSKLLIGYEATQLAKPQQFAVKKNEPPREDAGFYLFAARALELALMDFGGVARPYNVAVLPAAETEPAAGPFYVYLYPAQTQAGIYPLGGDVRYLLSADGTKILAKRQLHKTVIENPPAKGKKVVAGFHVQVLSDQPEDTDVLHVLQQQPPIPEIISTPHFTYQVMADGTIELKKSKKN
jgi:hypothetical protein